MPDTAPPADGSVLTSSYLQTMVREQVTRTVTSSTRPSAVEGMLFYETDTNRLYMYDGTGYIILSEPVQSYTPTWANTTLGNGTVTGSYQRHSGMCWFKASFVLGSTSAVGTGPTFTIPVAATATTIAASRFTVTFLDASVGYYPAQDLYSSTTTAGVGTFVVSGTYVGAYTAATATVPFTWTTSDGIFVTGWFPMSTLYL